MNISLPKKLAQKAKAQVKAGYYSSVSEVVRDGLRCLLKKEASVFKMNPKAEKKAIRALKEHKQGKTIKLNHPKELDNYV
jgi:putative addiction module CopG family antidote